MSRFTVLLIGVAGLALATTGFDLWRADRQQETKIDAVAPNGAGIENGSVDDYGVPPSMHDDAELQAAFEELLNDPDPDVRREAAKLAQEFGVMGDD